MTTEERFGSLQTAMQHLASMTTDVATMERMLVRAVMTYPHLLCELYGLRHEEVVSRCRSKIRAFTMDSGSRVPASPATAAPPAPRILPSPPQRRPVAPDRKKEARTRDAKAQLVRDLVQKAPAGADPAAATKFARQTIDASLALAQREFDERITASVDFRWGDLSLRHLDNLEVSVEYLSEIREGLRELAGQGRLPNETVELRDVLAPHEMKAFKERCKARRDAAIHAVETMRLTRG